MAGILVSLAWFGVMVLPTCRLETSMDALATCAALFFRLAGVPVEVEGGAHLEAARADVQRLS